MQASAKLGISAINKSTAINVVNVFFDSNEMAFETVQSCKEFTEHALKNFRSLYENAKSSKPKVSLIPIFLNEPNLMPF